MSQCDGNRHSFPWMCGLGLQHLRPYPVTDWHKPAHLHFLPVAFAMSSRLLIFCATLTSAVLTSPLGKLSMS